MAWIWTLSKQRAKAVSIRIQIMGGYKKVNRHLNNFLRNLPKSLNVVGTVGTSGEIRQVELNLIPTLIKTHGHGADERLDTGGGLVVGGTESSADVLVIEDLDLEGEVLLQVLDDHDEEGKLDGKGLLGLDGAGDEVGGDVSAHDLENGGLNISIGQSLDVTVSHVLVPNLERLGSDGVEDREETALVG